MSKLKYLSKSVSSGNKFTKVRHQALPSDTKVPILEAASEEDEEESTPLFKPDAGKTMTPQELARDVIFDLIDIVLEQAGDTNDINSD